MAWWMIMRLGVTMLTLVLALGCGTARTSVPRTYTVAATVQIDPKGNAIVCYPVSLLLLQGECVGGVPLTHVSGYSLPVANTFADGVVATKPLTLIGVWTGSALALTASPIVASSASSEGSVVWSATAPPEPAQIINGRPTEVGLRYQAKLRSDSSSLSRRGIFVAESGFDESGLVVTVAVADTSVIDFLRIDYGAQRIVSWFRPTR